MVIGNVLWSNLSEFKWLESMELATADASSATPNAVIPKKGLKAKVRPGKPI